jgi:divalent metal cation (Fe/Co/Zn/Cd) transporter
MGHESSPSNNHHGAPGMKHSTKGGSIALAMITRLTASKFILYAVSGSIAVLSEAWHSFADIVTTLLVVISIIRQDRKERCQNGPTQAWDVAPAG